MPFSTTGRRRRPRGHGGAPTCGERKVTIRGFGPFTVADAVADYLTAFERRGGKSVYGDRRAAETHILPALGATLVAKLTAKKIEDWHHGPCREAAPAHEPSPAGSKTTARLIKAPMVFASVEPPRTVSSPS